MPSVEVHHEIETPTGWRFSVEVASRRGGTTAHEITMSFQDYELACQGTRPPSRVVEDVVGRLLSGAIEAVPRPLPASFDVSTALRWSSSPADLFGAG